MKTIFSVFAFIFITLLSSCSQHDGGYDFDDSITYKGREYMVQTGEFRGQGDPMAPEAFSVNFYPPSQEARAHYPTLSQKDEKKLRIMAKPFAQKYCRDVFEDPSHSFPRSNLLGKSARFLYYCQ